MSTKLLKRGLCCCRRRAEDAKAHHRVRKHTILDEKKGDKDMFPWRLLLNRGGSPGERNGLRTAAERAMLQLLQRLVGAMIFSMFGFSVVFFPFYANPSLGNWTEIIKEVWRSHVGVIHVFIDWHKRHFCQRCGMSSSSL